MHIAMLSRVFQCFSFLILWEVGFGVGEVTLNCQDLPGTKIAPVVTQGPHRTFTTTALFQRSRDPSSCNTGGNPPAADVNLGFGGCRTAKHVAFSVPTESILRSLETPEIADSSTCSPRQFAQAEVGNLRLGDLV